jgi:hypothetical protein
MRLKVIANQIQGGCWLIKSFFMSFTPILTYEAKALMVVYTCITFFYPNFLVSFDIAEGASLQVVD